jgi:hypothetical protein
MTLSERGNNGWRNSKPPKRTTGRSSTYCRRTNLDDDALATAHMRDSGDDKGRRKPTTWEPIDLGLWMNGELPNPNHPASPAWTAAPITLGREYAISATERQNLAGFGCVAAELSAGHHCRHIHHEEGDLAAPSNGCACSTSTRHARQRLAVRRPSRPPEPNDNGATAPGPHPGGSRRRQRTSTDRADQRRYVKWQQPVADYPCSGPAEPRLRSHADGATLASRRHGSVHKATLTGATVLENTAVWRQAAFHVSRFGTGLRHLRANGCPAMTPETFGVRADDSETFGLFAARFFAKDDDQPADEAAGLADTVYDVIAALPDHAVTSSRMLSRDTQGRPSASRRPRRDAVDDRRHRPLIEVSPVSAAPRIPGCFDCVPGIFSMVSAIMSGDRVPVSLDGDGRSGRSQAIL